MTKKHLCDILTFAVKMEGSYMNISRIIGNNISLELKNKSIELSLFAEKIGFSLAEAHRLVEGRMFVPPFQLNKIANALEITREQLLEDRGMEQYNLLVHNFREFKNPENQELILDLFDMYADLAEAL